VVFVWLLVLVIGVVLAGSGGNLARAMGGGDMRKLRYNDPLCTDPVIHQESIVTEEEAIKYMRHAHPNHPYTDSEALEDFIVIYWAWWIEEEVSGQGAL
jgi:hypothetical protein